MHEKEGFRESNQVHIETRGAPQGLHRGYIGNPIFVRTFLNSSEVFVGLLIKF